MAKNEKTGKRAGSLAAKLLRRKSSGKAIKTVAASDLTQRPDHPKTKKKK